MDNTATGYQCCICRECLSENDYENSLEYFGKALCRKHQDLERQKWVCQKCGKQITRTVDYSIGHFSKSLCLDCQQYHHRMAVKGDNTFEGKGFYCNKCKQTITYPVYKHSMRMYGIPLCKDCQDNT
jgi:NAD-dependent SIR2 family protein deacetylase